MEQKTFSTSDLYLASALSVFLNTLPELQVTGRVVVFFFPASDALFRAIEAFNKGTALNALEYSRMIKKLKGDMLSMRDMARAGIAFGGKNATGR